MRSFTSVVLGASLLCLPAFAQFSGGVNVDFNATSGPGAGQPSVVHSGAALQGGYWNPVNPPYNAATSRTLRNLANSADAVTLTIESTSGTGSYSFNNANTSGDVELLYDDVHDLGLGGEAVYSVGPFAGGVYDVAVYAVAPESAASRVAVSVYTSSTGPLAEQSIGGTIPPAVSFSYPITHSIQRVGVARGERIYIRARATAGAGSVNGFQIKKRSDVTRLYVNPAATGEEEAGLNWSNACRSLQRALSIAADTPSVTEVWATRGQHFPDDGVLFSLGNRDATFRVPSNLLVLGGFVGTEATPADRGTTGPATILSGRNTARHVVTMNGVTGSRLESLNILDGNNELPFGNVNAGGAGLLVVDSTATLSKLRIAGNDAAGLGGAVLVQGSSNLTIEDGDALRNTAFGGSFLSSNGGQVTLNRMRIGSNTATATTGGVFDINGAGSSLRMNNTLVANNQHPAWIIDASAGGSMELRNCTFANNLTTGGIGAGVGIAGPGGSVVRNCIVYGNAKDSGPITFLQVLRFTSGFGGVSDNIVQQWDGSLTDPVYLNIDADPLFTFPHPAGLLSPTDILGAGRYNLGSRSPARDSGWDGAAPVGNDINDQPRIIDDPLMVNTGFAGGTIDRGCSEAQGSSAPCPGDLGRAGGLPGPDGLRDNNDFIAFINFFFELDARGDLGQSGGLPGSDGLFDNNDFIAFIDLFFTACP